MIRTENTPEPTDTNSVVHLLTKMLQLFRHQISTCGVQEFNANKTDNILAWKRETWKWETGKKIPEELTEIEALCSVVLNSYTCQVSLWSQKGDWRFPENWHRGFIKSWERGVLKRFATCNKSGVSIY